jgi:small-conductance mechanosensitive channel
MQKYWRVLSQIRPTELLEPLIIFIVALALAWVARNIFLKVLGAWATRTGRRPALIFREALAGPTRVWVFLLAMHVALQGSELPVQLAHLAAQVLLALWIVSLTFLASKLAGDMVQIYGDQVPGALPVTTLTQSLAQLGVVILGIVVLAGAMNFNITPILTALGVGGLAVALALQDTLSNLFSGFYVAVARQVRLGDYIRLNTGEEGYVTDIGWRSTTIRALSNNIVIVPNAKLAQAIVTNFYLPERRMSTSLVIFVNYENDPERVENLLLEIAKGGIGEISGLLGDPAPAVTLDPGFGESGLGFTVGFHIAEFANQYGVRHELRKRIFQRFREEKIEIPYPTRVVHLRDGSKPDGGPEHR